MGLHLRRLGSRSPQRFCIATNRLDKSADIALLSGQGLVLSVLHFAAEKAAQAHVLEVVSGRHMFFLSQFLRFPLNLYPEVHKELPVFGSVLAQLCHA